MKWFEKNWFVNLKIRTRYLLCFLLIAILAVGVGIAGIIVVMNAKVAGWQTFAVVIGAAALLAVLLSVLLANINAFLVTDPTNKNTMVIEKYSTGNYNVRSFLRDRDMITFNFKDEVGDLSRALKGFRLYSDNLVNCLKLVAQGDLSAEVPVCSPDDQIGNQLKELVDNFHQLVASIASAIDQVAAGADLVSDSSATLSQGATHQASSLQELDRLYGADILPNAAKRPECRRGQRADEECQVQRVRRQCAYERNAQSHGGHQRLLRKYQ